MVQPAPDRFSGGWWLAPLVFLAHVVEESRGFLPWFNAHVAQGITTDLFWTVNAAALVITVMAVAGLRATGSAAATALLVAWLSFLMLTNAVFHVTAAAVDGGYVPGLATAILLYLPYCAWAGWRLVRGGRVAPGMLAAAALLGAIPMAVHGYRILFLGTRLF